MKPVKKGIQLIKSGRKKYREREGEKEREQRERKQCTRVL